MDFTELQKKYVKNAFFITHIIDISLVYKIEICMFS